MAKVPTPQTSAKLILHGFKIAQLRVGEMLLVGSLMMDFQHKGFNSEDLNKGLQLARRQDWIAIDGSKVFLTDAGYAEMLREAGTTHHP